MQEKAFGYVYRITNLINQKTYIGLRYYSSDRGKPWTFYMGSGVSIKSAIAKYGKENFHKEKLFDAFNREALETVELELIKAEIECFGKENVYNIFYGQGAGGDTFSKLNEKTLEEIKEKQSRGLKNSKKAADARKQRVTKRLEHKEKIYKEYGSLITTTYKELKSVEKVASELNFSKTEVTFVLKKSNAPMNRRNVIGVNHTKETKEKIGLSLSREKETFLFLNQMEKEIINLLEDNSVSISEILDKFSVSKNMLKKWLISKNLQNTFKKGFVIDEIGEKINLWLPLYKEGKSLREISRKTGLKHQYLSLYIKEHIL